MTAAGKVPGRTRNSRSGERPKTVPAREGIPQRIPLANLHFDSHNARFGNRYMDSQDEIAILDEIVETYGVDGVISSIAVNGYLETEPLVAIGTAESAVVIEGNRRLAALLILEGDPRSINQSGIRKLHREVSRPINRVPTVLYGSNAQPEQLLPYLGVKHIVGPKAWDAYAKAAWIARLLREHGDRIDLETVQEMIGDSLGTVRRLMRGYYVVEQLIRKGKFDPQDSEKKGRGSASEFPFSWIYNATDFGSVRKFIGLEGNDPLPDPLTEKGEDKAVLLLAFMFGSRKRAMPSLIDESRQISRLASCLDDPVKVKKLTAGVRLEDVEWQSKTGEEKLTESLGEVDIRLGQALAASYDLTRPQAVAVRPLAEKVRNLSRDLVREVQKRVDGEDD